MLRQRIHALEQQVAQTDARLDTQKQAVKRAKQPLAEAEQQMQERKPQVHALEAENALNLRKLGVKRQVHVAAHVSAQVILDSGDKLLKFSEQSAFAGQVLSVTGDHPPPQKAQF